MKAVFNFLKFLALATWVLVASMIITLISVTSPNWTPVNFLITQNPLIGRSRKSIGSNIGYKWFNKNVFRTKALQFTEGVSASRDVQKAFFTLCQAFAKNVLSVIRIGMKQQATEMPAYSYYIGWLLRNAGNAYPGPATIDEAKVIMSKGTLQQPSDMVFSAVAGKKIDFTWTDDSETGNALATDIFHAVWYNQTKNLFGSELTGIVKRSDGNWSLAIPSYSNLDVVFGWAFFTDAAGQIVSDSGVSQEISILT